MLVFDEVIGWYDPSEAYCINGDGNPAKYEDLYAMYGEHEIVQMVCLECKDKLNG
jgi:hypothetical protein